jgi:osmotically-inducible protein OsmY
MLNINVEREGVVVLRGQVQRDEIIRDVEARVRRVAGVRDVENLMHLPGTPVRTHA